jgi:hypothetical protein
MMKNKKDILKQMVKAIPLVYVFLVFYGSIYFYFFYNAFHINIFRYLDISEIAVSFLNVTFENNIDIFSLSILIYVIFKLLRLYDKDRIEEENKNNLLQPKWNIILIAVCVIYIYYVSDNLFLYNKDQIFVFNDNIGYGILIVLIIISLIIDLIKHNIKFLILNAMIIFILATVISAVEDVQKTLSLSSVKYTTTIITKDNDTIRTNNTCYFVGRTNKYVFLFKSKDTTNEYIPTNEIKKFIFKK